jgi:hypothetical protein
MSRIGVIGWVIGMILLLQAPTAAAQLPGDMVTSDGRMIKIHFNRKNESECAALLESFGLQEDSLFEYGHIGKLSEEGWQIIRWTRNKVVIGMPLFDPVGFDWVHMPVFDLGTDGNVQPGYPKDVPIGANSFNQLPGVYENADHRTVFTLQGHLEAQEVYVSGSFNDWSVSGTPMSKTSTGWEAALPLKNGQHLYKFIVDGQWISDPNNRLTEYDGYGGENSIYYHENYTWKLEGFTDAREVILAGSFNNWDEGQLKLKRSDSGWELPVYLRDGTHTYKYIVDGQWITDPSNPKTLADGEGNINSVISKGQSYTFTLHGFQQANQVMLAGSFNNWRPGELPMTRTVDGWELDYILGPGNYEYKFIVDGQWMQDPDNPLRVGTDLNSNSLLSVEPNFVFRLEGYPNARTVGISGSFNQWVDPGYSMQREGDAWVYRLHLNAGKYIYKFVVDGVWIVDPANDMMEPNEFDQFNSVLWLDAETEFQDSPKP